MKLYAITPLLKGNIREGESHTEITLFLVAQNQDQAFHQFMKTQIAAEYDATLQGEINDDRWSTKVGEVSALGLNTTTNKMVFHTSPLYRVTYKRFDNETPESIVIAGRDMEAARNSFEAATVVKVARGFGRFQSYSVEPFDGIESPLDLSPNDVVDTNYQA